MPVDVKSRETSPRSSEHGPLDERVRELLTRTMGSLAFNGLRRTLGAHPESLSRALRRLEREGVIQREDGGYSLISPDPGPEETDAPPRTRPLGEVQLPLGIDVEEVVGDLAGRWFGRLRWVGMYDRPSEPGLVWSLEGTPGHLVLHVGPRSLKVAAEWPSASEVPETLARAAEDLLVRALHRIRRDAPVNTGATPFADRGSSTLPFAA